MSKRLFNRADGGWLVGRRRVKVRRTPGRSFPRVIFQQLGQFGARLRWRLMAQRKSTGWRCSHSLVLKVLLPINRKFSGKIEFQSGQRLKLKKPKYFF